MTAGAAVAAGVLERELLAVGLAGAVVLGVAIAGRWHDLLPWGIALLAAPYAASLLLRDGGIDALAPLYAAGLLFTAELGYWAMETTPGVGGAAAVLPRAGSLLALALAAGGAATLVLAVSDVGAGGGFVLEVVGVAAAAGALALVAWLAWRPASR